MGNTFKTGNYVNAIFQDTSNNIGIGGSPSGSYKLDVTGTAGISGITKILSSTASTSTTTGALVVTGGVGIGGSVYATNGLLMGNGGATATTNYLPKFTGTSTIGNSIVQDSGSAITITGSNYLFNLTGGGSSRIAASINNTSGNLEWGLEGSAGNQLFTGMAAYQAGIGTSNNTSLNFATNTVVRMILSASGNLGLGVTPSAWEDAKALQIGSAAAPYLALFQQTTSTSDGYLGWNARLTGYRTFAYITTGDAVSLYRLNAGQHTWLTAPSGTAGNAISFTQAMTLNASGNLSIGNTNNTYRLDVTGTGKFGGTNTYNSFLIGSHSNNVGAAIYNSGNAAQTLYADSSSTVLNAEANLYLRTGNTDRLTLSSTGAATFSSLGTGTVTATGGTLSTTSDMNLKIEDGYIDNALDKVLKLTPRYFLWKEESGLPTDLRQLGFYAQEVNEVLGEEVANTPKTENDSWGIYDRGIIAMLTKAIQEQNQTIQSLQERITKGGL